MSKERFEVEGKEYFIKNIDSKTLAEAQKVYTKAFRGAIEDGAILKKSLDDHMRRQGLWDDKKQTEYTDLIKRSADIEYRIKSGQYTKASDLKQKAIELRQIRNEISNLLSVRNSLDANTAEGQADNARFNFLVSKLVYDYATQKPVFSSLSDYEERGSTALAIECAGKFASYMYGIEENFEETLIENKLLRKLNLLDKEGNLINRDGHRVDYEGNLLDESGSRIDAEGNRIDINNNPILDDSVIDSLDFEDDLAMETEVKKKTRKKTPAS